MGDRTYVEVPITASDPERVSDIFLPACRRSEDGYTRVAFSAATKSPVE